MKARKDNYLGARLTGDAIQFLRQEFPDNLSKGIQVALDAYRNVILLTQVELKEKRFTMAEIKTLSELKRLNQDADDATLNVLAEQNQADPIKLKKKIESLGRIEKYVLFDQLALYGFDTLKKRFDIKP